MISILIGVWESQGAPMPFWFLFWQTPNLCWKSFHICVKFLTIPHSKTKGPPNGDVRSPGLPSLQLLSALRAEGAAVTGGGDAEQADICQQGPVKLVSLFSHTERLLLIRNDNVSRTLINKEDSLAPTNADGLLTPMSEHIVLVVQSNAFNIFLWLNIQWQLQPLSKEPRKYCTAKLLQMTAKIKSCSKKVIHDCAGATIFFFFNSDQGGKIADNYIFQCCSLQKCLGR